MKPTTAQMALDTINELMRVSYTGFSVRYDANKVIAALEAEIAQPVEPVGIVIIEDMGAPFKAKAVRLHFYKETPPAGTEIYTDPPTVAINAELLEALKHAVFLRQNLCDGRDQKNDPHLDRWNAIISKSGAAIANAQVAGK